MITNSRPSMFHISIPMVSPESTRSFYENLGCRTGRVSPHALTFDFFGHQLVAHMVSTIEPQASIYPRHFGVCFERRGAYAELLARIDSAAIGYFRDPIVRFEGLPIEHATVFVKDPSGNIIEFKHYKYFEAALGMQEHASVGDLDEQLQILDVPNSRTSPPQ